MKRNRVDLHVRAVRQAQSAAHLEGGMVSEVFTNSPYSPDWGLQITTPDGLVFDVYILSNTDTHTTGCVQIRDVTGKETIQ